MSSFSTTTSTRTKMTPPPPSPHPHTFWLRGQNDLPFSADPVTHAKLGVRRTVAKFKIEPTHLGIHVRISIYSERRGGGMCCKVWGDRYFYQLIMLRRVNDPGSKSWKNRRKAKKRTGCYFSYFKGWQFYVITVKCRIHCYTDTVTSLSRRSHSPASICG